MTLIRVSVINDDPYFFCLTSFIEMIIVLAKIRENFSWR
jgi:hypothetical protein